MIIHHIFLVQLPRSSSSVKALPGKQRPEPEQLFGVSCKNSSAARETAAGDSSYPGVKPLPWGINPNNCDT